MFQILYLPIHSAIHEFCNFEIVTVISLYFLIFFQISILHKNLDPIYVNYRSELKFVSLNNNYYLFIPYASYVYIFQNLFPSVLES